MLTTGKSPVVLTILRPTGEWGGNFSIDVGILIATPLATPLPDAVDFLNQLHNNIHKIFDMDRARGYGDSDLE